VPTITLHELETSQPAPGTCTHNRTVHLIRHAQGWHNIDELEAEAAFERGDAKWKDIDLRDPKNVALRSEYGIAWTLLEQVTGRKYHDPHLTPVGREQAYALRARLRTDPTFAVDAVALSPMRRTIETALLGLPQLEGASTAFTWRHDDDPPRAPPMVANDVLRERCAHFMPDSRLTRTELAHQFSALAANASIDFSEVPELDVPFLGGAERDEPEVGSAVLAARAGRALRWLAALPASYARLAVVSHCHFLAAITALYPHTVRQAKFSNAELRTMIMCIEGASGSEESESESQTESAQPARQPAETTVKPITARVTPMADAERYKLDRLTEDI